MTVRLPAKGIKVWDPPGEALPRGVDGGLQVSPGHNWAGEPRIQGQAHQVGLGSAPGTHLPLLSLCEPAPAIPNQQVSP